MQIIIRKWLLYFLSFCSLASAYTKNTQATEDIVALPAPIDEQNTDNNLSFESGVTTIDFTVPSYTIMSISTYKVPWINNTALAKPNIIKINTGANVLFGLFNDFESNNYIVFHESSDNFHIVRNGDRIYLYNSIGTFIQFQLNSQIKHVVHLVCFSDNRAATLVINRDLAKFGGREIKDKPVHLTGDITNPISPINTDRINQSIPQQINGFFYLAGKSLFSISKGSYFHILGSNGLNSVIIESGARARFDTLGDELYDITIKSSSSGYKIYSVKHDKKDTCNSYLEDMVYIEHSNGTRIEIKASEPHQKINFADAHYQLFMKSKKIYFSSEDISQRIKHKKISLPLLKQMQSNQSSLKGDK